MQENTDEEKMFLIEGTISEFIAATRMVNLLEELKVGSSAQNVAAGIAGAVGGMAGLVSNAAMLEMYDGERVENFACYIDDKIVIGQFSGAFMLNDGDQVKAVVTKKDDVLYAHAILRPKDKLLWLPLEADSGYNVVFSRMMKLALGLTIFATVFFWIMLMIVSGGVAGFHIYIYALLFDTLLGFSLAAWVANDLKPLALRAEQIFTVLGFPDVETLNMRPACYALHHDNVDNAESVYHYQWVLDAHARGEKLRLGKTPVDNSEKKS